MHALLLDEKVFTVLILHSSDTFISFATDASNLQTKVNYQKFTNSSHLPSAISHLALEAFKATQEQDTDKLFQ
jgi:hypothetical protein